ncbi:MAG: chromate resistance protein, partial [Anaerolineales bacterium]|nr:chromate resistance protein [Anaerolineales bacterium]
QRGHCTFHTFLKEYNLTDPVLSRIANIVDEADIVQEIAVEPAAAGLDLICRGVRSISKNDDEAWKNGTLIYDALFAQLSAGNP